MPSSPRVALVVMPFLSEDGPAHGASILRAAWSKAGISCDLLYLNLDFAARIGLERYRSIDRVPTALMGERVFATALLGHEAPALDRYLEAIGLADLPPDEKKQFAAFEDEATRFIAHWAASPRWAEYDIIGFSTTFQQNTASLALARRIKAAAPSVRIVFGGANCEGAMGRALLDLFPFLDAVCTGEGEDAAQALTDAWPEWNRLDHPNLATRTTNKVAAGAAPPMPTMDDLPIPDFSDYFDQLHKTLPLLPASSMHLRLETSRGCWWGERAHCTFCGLNGATMKFRSKSSGRILEEFHSMRRYPTRSILLSDNILDESAYSTWLPLLAEEKEHARIFLELRPPLTIERAEILAAAGVRRIQAGLESLSTRSLGLMRKGGRSIENIALLQVASETSISVTWNLLVGIPGESEEEIEEMATLIPSLHHLQPPVGVFEAQVHRFSPWFVDPGKWGLGGLTPLPAYTGIYPFETEAVSALAYYFARATPFDRTDAHARLALATTQWRGAALSGRCSLLLSPDREGGEILDARQPVAATRYRITSEECRLLLSCRAPIKADADASEVERRTIAALEAKRLLLRRDGLLLSLPSITDGNLDAAAATEGAQLRALSREGSEA